MITKLKISFKNRIALNYLFSGAFLIAIVFIVIFQTVKYSVNKHINEEVQEELMKHLDDVSTDENDTYLIQVDQWRAREHNSINVNPVFVQFYDNQKVIIDKSPNLKESNLSLSDENDQFINATLNAIPVRQIQTKIINNQKTVGYLVVAMSMEDFEIVAILKNILFISFPLIMLVLFLFARFFAGKSIQPVRDIIATSNRITKDNLSERIPLPPYKDELHDLSSTINKLLSRIENAIEREKQFTADASHELRTPLAVMKGTLEVLIRKPRTETEYKEKTKFIIQEIDRLNLMVDQLLLLARFENQKLNSKKEQVYLNALILDNIALFSNEIASKKLKINTNFSTDFYIESDYYLTSIVLGNLISNAIKYAAANSEIKVVLNQETDFIIFTIKNFGIGISESDQEKVFNSFYRTAAINQSEVKGSGLGLSIVKRLCEVLNFGISLESENATETTFTVQFNK